MASEKDTQRGGAGNFANNPERASEAGRADSPSSPAASLITRPADPGEVLVILPMIRNARVRRGRKAAKRPTAAPGRNRAAPANSLEGAWSVSARGTLHVASWPSYARKRVSRRW
jgi:hypothetical protein